MIDGATENHRLNSIAVGLRQRQGLQQHRSHPFTGHKPIGPLAKAMAATIGRQEAQTAQGNVFGRMQQQIHPTSDRHGTFTPPQGLDSQVNGRQGRRAGRIHRQAGALAIQKPGHPVGHGPIGGGSENLVTAQPFLGREQLITAPGDAHKNAHPTRGAIGRLTQAIGGVARIFKGVPGGLQKQPLLGIHGNRFSGGNPEKQGIELINPIQESAPTADALAGVLVRIPAAGGHFGNAICARRQVVPKVLQGVGSGEASGHANDGDRFLGIETARSGGLG